MSTETASDSDLFEDHETFQTNETPRQLDNALLVPHPPQSCDYFTLPQVSAPTSATSAVAVHVCCILPPESSATLTSNSIVIRTCQDQQRLCEGGLVVCCSLGQARGRTLLATASQRSPPSSHSSRRLRLQSLDETPAGEFEEEDDSRKPSHLEAPMRVYRSGPRAIKLCERKRQSMVLVISDPEV
eukprot:767529-Hanusia_phi.AAC.4